MQDQVFNVFMSGRWPSTAKTFKHRTHNHIWTVCTANWSSVWEQPWTSAALSHLVPSTQPSPACNQSQKTDERKGRKTKVMNYKGKLDQQVIICFRLVSFHQPVQHKLFNSVEGQDAYSQTRTIPHMSSLGSRYTSASLLRFYHIVYNCRMMNNKCIQTDEHHGKRNRRTESKGWKVNLKSKWTQEQQTKQHVETL